MAEFKTEVTYSVVCPVCQSTDVKRDGKQSGEQRYRCKPCQKKFRASGKAPGRKMDAELMGSAIRDYYTGKSYKQIAEGLANEYDIPEPSKAHSLRVGKGLHRYCRQANGRGRGTHRRPLGSR